MPAKALIPTLFLLAPGVFAFQCLPEAVTGSGSQVSDFPAVSTGALFIAYQSTADPLGFNGDFNAEIFLLESNTGTLIQLTTSATPATSGEPSLDGAGHLLAFSSSANLLGDNPSGIYEVYLYNLQSQAISRISFSTSASRGAINPRLSWNGGSVIYLSDGNPLGSNFDLSDEVFHYDLGSGTTQQVSGTVLDGPNTDAGSAHCDGAGRFIAYSKLASPVRLYLRDMQGGGLSEIASQVVGNPVLDFTGGLVYYPSDGDPLGSNGDGNAELFVYDRLLDQRQQLTQTTGGSLSPDSLRMKGAILYWVSDLDLTGENPQLEPQWFRMNRAGVITQLTQLPPGASPGSLDTEAADRFLVFSHGGSGTFEVYRQGLPGAFLAFLPFWPGQNLFPLLAELCP